MENAAGPTVEGGAFVSGDICVDAEGEWFHRGAKIVREDIIELFLENLVRQPDGTYGIAWKGSRCSIDVADTPFVVIRVDREEGADAGEPVVRLTLKHLRECPLLDPRTLRVGDANVLYCRLENGGFPARFSRPAYYQLAEWIVEDEAGETFCLELGRARYPIRTTDNP